MNIDNCAILFNPEDFEELQYFLFRNGYKWINNHRIYKFEELFIKSESGYYVCCFYNDEQVYESKDRRIITTNANTSFYRNKLLPFEKFVSRKDKLKLLL